MSDYDSIGARMATSSNWEDEALQGELNAKIRREALEAFINLNPVPETLIKQIAHVHATMWAGQKLLRDYIQKHMLHLVANDLLDEADMEILSEHVFRRLGDAHSAADNLHHLHDELLSIDLETILTRYKG